MFTNTTVENAVIPAIALKNLVPLPNNEIRIDVARPKSIEAIKFAANNGKYIALFVQKNPLIDNVTIDNIFLNGVIAKVVYHLEGQVNKVKLLGVTRCKLNELTQEDPFWMASVTSIPAFNTNINEELAYVRILVSEIEKNGQRLLNGNREVISMISQGITADKLSDILVYNMKLDLASKMRYLNNPDVTQRLKYLVEDIKKENAMFEIDAKIEEEVRKSINDSQKEYYLREKMKAIQNELGDKAKKETEIDELKEKILKAKMPKNMEDKALNELNRYSMMSSMSGESSIVRTYLDFILSLPWNEKSVDNRDIKKAKDQLDADHYGLEKVKERILEYLAVSIMTQKTPQAILCLVGPPGVGKTSLARSIASSLNKEFVKQALGGVKDESEIRGHRRTYLGALPGRILQGMKKAKVTNPVFLLDEVDKLTSDYRGDPASALLEVLDGEQNKYFSDNYLEEPYDLSNVFFIATANYLENIPAPLRDRMEIVQLSSYTEFEKFEIAKRHLLDKQLILNGLSKCDFELSDSALWRIIREYTREAGVRELERHIGTLIRKAIKSILMKESVKVIITEENLEEWLGKPRYEYTKLDSKDQVGVVTGLAYTQFGGDTLPVEVTYYKGSGKLVLTGKLGDVMKESAQAALSYAKTNASKYGIDMKMFEENDIHIHVPEGAVPKDGPSAGVTIATAIISCLSNRLVNHSVGMTGEITLRGRVLPIGGLREKSIAAHRSGLTRIIIPKDNLKDLEEVPETIKNELEIVTASTVDDVISNSLL